VLPPQMTSVGHCLESISQLQPDFKQMLEKTEQIHHILFISVQEAETNNSFSNYQLYAVALWRI